MPDIEHLKIIRQGVKIWNEWREENADVNPDLSEAHLAGKNLTEANLLGVNLRCANLNRAELRDAKLALANLAGADLSWADLNAADLYHAELSDADFSNANLNGVNFEYANLSRANLSHTELKDARFTNADLNLTNVTGAEIGGTTFGGNNLGVVKGLDTLSHEGPSFLSIETLYISEGNIPVAFLQGVGVPEDFIVHMRSSTRQALEFYSCFISFSYKDKTFAKQLHRDLQNEGVRCWFEPDDMRIGDRVRDRIYESIRSHDKLLLILSEHSVLSQWVGDEVEAAFERERKEERSILFPIKIDNAVVDSETSWASSIRHSRHIGDFIQWEDPDLYKTAFNKLLRDLTASRVKDDKK